MDDAAIEVTLFLVEDDDVDAMTIERCFHQQHIGNPVVRARDGVEVFEMLKAGAVKQPYVVLPPINRRLKNCRKE